MKRLVVLRHAKSSWDDPALGDFERPLNGRGREAALKIGEELKRRALTFDLAIASPAVRVRQTLDQLEQSYGELCTVDFREEFYLASSSTLLRALRGLSDEVSIVLVAGHNPGLQELVLLLAAPDQPLHGQVREKFPTSATALLDIQVGQWSELERGGASLMDLILPRSLDG